VECAGEGAGEGGARHGVVSLWRQVEMLDDLGHHRLELREGDLADEAQPGLDVVRDAPTSVSPMRPERDAPAPFTLPEAGTSGKMGRRVADGAL